MCSYYFRPIGAIEPSAHGAQEYRDDENCLHCFGGLSSWYVWLLCKVKWLCET